MEFVPTDYSYSRVIFSFICVSKMVFFSCFGLFSPHFQLWLFFCIIEYIFIIYEKSTLKKLCAGNGVDAGVPNGNKPAIVVEVEDEVEDEDAKFVEKLII